MRSIWEFVHFLLFGDPSQEEMFGKAETMFLRVQSILAVVWVALSGGIVLSHFL